MNLLHQEDTPAATPRFEYDLLAGGLAQLLVKEREAALVIGIHGSWGAGKTTLMHAVRQQLAKTLKSENPQEEPVFITFNAWKFQDRQTLWRALILHVLGELRRFGGDNKTIEELERSLYRAFVVEEKVPDGQLANFNYRGSWNHSSAVHLDFVANAIRESTGWFGRLSSRATNEEANVIPFSTKSGLRN